MKYVNDRIREVDVERIQWSVVARKLKRRSLIDSKNKFMQILEYSIKTHPFHNMDIVRFISQQNVEVESQIRWEEWSG